MAYEQPQVRAGGDISTYRFVIPAGADFTVTAAGASAANCIGACTGDNKEFDEPLHAQEGDQVRIQPGPMIQVAASGTISVGTRVSTGAAGTVVAQTVGQSVGVALTSAVANEICWIYFDNGAAS